MDYLEAMTSNKLVYVKKYIAGDVKTIEFTESFTKNEGFQAILLIFLTELPHLKNEEIEVLKTVIMSKNYLSKLLVRFKIPQLFKLDLDETEDEDEGQIQDENFVEKPNKLLLDLILLITVDCKTPLSLKVFFKDDLAALRALQKENGVLKVEQIRTVLKRKSPPLVDMEEKKRTKRPVVDIIFQRTKTSSLADPDGGVTEEEPIFKKLEDSFVKQMLSCDPSQALNMWAQKQDCGAHSLEVKFKTIGEPPITVFNCELSYRGVTLARGVKRSKKMAKKEAAKLALQKMFPMVFKAKN